MPIRTSITDPLRIDEVSAHPAPGVIGITFCPGKRDAKAAAARENGRKGGRPRKVDPSTPAGRAQ